MKSRVSFYIDLCKMDNFMKDKDFAQMKVMCSENESYIDISAYFIEWYLRYKPSHKIKVFERHFIEEGYSDRNTLDKIDKDIVDNNLDKTTKLLDYLYLQK